MNTYRTLFPLGLLIAGWALTSLAAELPRADRERAQYFQAEVERLGRACLADVRTRADWEGQREERRRQLLDMLGLWPLPPRTDLKPIVTGTVDGDRFVVEKLQFQSLPGLYVTANLYLPRGLAKLAPAILYVCGHAEVKTNSVSLGNKTAYQHHGAWLARHGYVCLVIDTVQLGEIQGLHHGTYRLDQWWWNARGYTPAGVEAWNCVRALDYLETRSEVDRTRLGMTGRSGGGSYTWTTAAIDHRIKAAAPVAGMTDLQNQVVDGCVEGHCDCMFFLNTYRWDFPLDAALIAPRPLLIVNSDADSLFPLDGVERLHARVKRLYQLYDATNQLGLVIGPGGHKDTQDLQVPVLRWFNQFLKNEDPLIEDAATKPFDPQALRVFDALPTDQRNTRIQETFVPAAANGAAATPGDTEALLRRVRAQVFGGWPADSIASTPRLVATEERQGLRLRVFAFESQDHVSLNLFVAEPGGQRRPRSLVVTVLDGAGWTNWLASLRPVFPRALGEFTMLGATAGKPGDRPSAAALAQALKSKRAAQIWFVPRGLGPGAWSGDAKQQIQIRRRFMLIGQTLDGMRVWDVRRAVQAARGVYGNQPPSITLEARGTMGVNAVYASLFESGIAELDLQELPASHRDGPDYLNVLRFLDIPQALELARSRLRPAPRR